MRENNAAALANYLRPVVSGFGRFLVRDRWRRQRVVRGLPEGHDFAGGAAGDAVHFRAYQQRIGSATMALVWCAAGQAAEWSNTEFQLQIGNLDVPSFAGGGSADHVIYTLQHASGWKYGGNFFFVDVLDSRQPGFHDIDLYSELYANFSLGKIGGNPIGAEPVSDVGLIGGFNWAADANAVKYVAGIRLALDLEGFAFANLDVAALVDDSDGLASGGAPAEDNTILVDFNFARPFKRLGKRTSASKATSNTLASAPMNSVGRSSPGSSRSPSSNGT